MDAIVKIDNSSHDLNFIRCKNVHGKGYPVIANYSKEKSSNLENCILKLFEYLMHL